MRACIQRVKFAKVTVDNAVVGQIDAGMLVLLGVTNQDRETNAEQLAEKLARLRIFSDEQGKMNLDLAEVGGAMLVVSQFTLAGDCRKGRRPSFDSAAKPEIAERLYEHFVKCVKSLGIATATGKFRADMQVELLNDGPVTFVIDL